MQQAFTHAVRTADPSLSADDWTRRHTVHAHRQKEKKMYILTFYWSVFGMWARSTTCRVKSVLPWHPLTEEQSPTCRALRWKEYITGRDIYSIRDALASKCRCQPRTDHFLMKDNSQRKCWARSIRWHGDTEVMFCRHRTLSLRRHANQEMQLLF